MRRNLQQKKVHVAGNAVLSLTCRYRTVCKLIWIDKKTNNLKDFVPLDDMSIL